MVLMVCVFGVRSCGFVVVGGRFGSAYLVGFWALRCSAWDLNSGGCGGVGFVWWCC